MKPEYQDWIDQNVDDAYGECAAVTQAMADQFPELTRVRGHYYCFSWGERAHWWLTDGEEIVDPTAKQFPSRGKGAYVPWVDGTPEPTGICANCGEPAFNGDTVCSDACGNACCGHGNVESAYVVFDDGRRLVNGNWR